MIGGGDGPGDGPTLGGIDAAVTSTFLALGLAAWSVPALALGVPGLLVLIVVMLQLAGGFAWLPIARRALSRERHGTRPGHPRPVR